MEFQIHPLYILANEDREGVEFRFTKKFINKFKQLYNIDITNVDIDINVRRDIRIISLCQKLGEKALVGEYILQPIPPYIPNKDIEIGIDTSSDDVEIETITLLRPSFLRDILQALENDDIKQAQRTRIDCEDYINREVEFYKKLSSRDRELFKEMLNKSDNELIDMIRNKINI